MPFNGSGSFVRLYSWVADKNAGIDINAQRMDNDTDDITGNGLDLCLTRDGQGSAQDDLPMNGFVHTGVGDAAQTNQYASANQIQHGSIIFGVSTGTGDAIVGTFAPPVTVLTDGMQLNVRAPGANTITTPTFAPNSVTATVITKDGGSPLAASDYASGQELILRYALAANHWEYVNAPPVATPPQTITLTGDVTGSGTGSFAATITNTNAKNAGSNALGNVTISTSDPSGTPANGDRWIKYSP